MKRLLALVSLLPLLVFAQGIGGGSGYGIEWLNLGNGIKIGAQISAAGVTSPTVNKVRGNRVGFSGSAMTVCQADEGGIPIVTGAFKVEIKDYYVYLAGELVDEEHYVIDGVPELPQNLPATSGAFSSFAKQGTQTFKTQAVFAVYYRDSNGNVTVGFETVEATIEPDFANAWTGWDNTTLPNSPANLNAARIGLSGQAVAIDHSIHPATTAEALQYIATSNAFFVDTHGNATSIACTNESNINGTNIVTFAQLAQQSAIPYDFAYFYSCSVMENPSYVASALKMNTNSCLLGYTTVVSFLAFDTVAGTLVPIQNSTTRFFEELNNVGLRVSDVIDIVNEKLPPIYYDDGDILFASLQLEGDSEFTL